VTVEEYAVDMAASACALQMNQPGLRLVQESEYQVIGVAGVTLIPAI
jgi:hypothetical protein